MQKITSGQFFVLMYLSSITYVSTLNSSTLNNNFTDSLLSVIASSLLSIILSLPVFFLHDKYEEFNAQKLIKSKAKSFCVVIFSLYIIYFLICDVIMLSLLIDLLVSTIFPSIQPIYIAFMVLIVSAYGAFKGIESIARAGLIILVLAVIGMLLVILGLFNLYDSDNRQVVLYNGFSDMLSNTVVIFIRSSFLPQALFLLSFVKGRTVKNSIITNSFTGVFTYIVIFFIIHCLGLFATIELFPVHTLSSVSKLLPIQRLDIVFVMLWFAILVIKISTDFIAIGSCIKNSFIRKHRKLFFISCAAVVLIFTFLLSQNNSFKMILVDPIITGSLILLLGLILPIILLMIKRGQND